MPLADKRKEDFVVRALDEPALYPDEFKAWLPRYLEAHPLFRIQTSALPAVQEKQYVGTSGVPAFEGTWANLGGGYESVNYYIDPFRHVFLSGVVAAGVAGTVIFTLPSNSVPAATELYYVYTNTGPGVISVANTGYVTHVSGGTALVQLSGINFRAY